MGRAPSLAQVGFYAVLLVGGGAVFAALALLVSSLVEGQYTAPIVSFGVVLACFNAPRLFKLLNPLDFISGNDYLGASLRLVGPIPWARLAANLVAAAILIVLSVKIIQARDF
jgi:ABC-2 type transport system permease protein